MLGLVIVILLGGEVDPLPGKVVFGASWSELNIGIFNGVAESVLHVGFVFLAELLQKLLMGEKEFAVNSLLE